MEIDDEIRFDNKPFTIKDIIYRTPGSADQRLISQKDRGDQKVVGGRLFYLVESDGVTYWVKHYVDPNFGILGDANYEYDRMREYGEYRIDSRSISPVHVRACRDNMILMDYCRYPRLNKIKLTSDLGDVIDDLVAEWIKKWGVKDYDMHPNNMLVDINKNRIVVRLVDFEKSPRSNVYNYFIKKNLAYLAGIS